MKNYKKIASLGLAASLFAGSGFTAFAAAELPENYLVVGDDAYDLNYVIEDREAFSTFLNDAIRETGYDNLDLYAFTGSEVTNAKTKLTISEAEAQAVVDGLDTLINAENPEGVQIGEQTGDLAVSSVSAINTTTIEATLVISENVTEENLTGKTLTVTAGETTLTATYEAGSLVDSKANFILSGSDVLVDATTYTVSGDDFSFTNDTFVAKVAEAHVASFVQVTSNIAAVTGGATSTNIYFTTKNQYDEDLEIDATNTANVEVAVTINGVPLLGSEATYTEGNDYVTLVNKDFAKDAVIAVTLTNKDSDSNVVGTNTFTYTVLEAEAAVATTISEITAAYNKAANGHAVTDAVTEIMPDDEITLTADVRDQFGNPFSTPSVRWVVTEGGTLIDADPEVAADADIADSTKNYTVDSTVGNTISFQVTDPGNFTIRAYIIDNGATATYTSVLGAKALTSINALTFANDKFNNEATVSNALVYTTGANLTPDMLKFEVTDAPEGATASDITLTAAYSTVEGSETDILITATTTKAGTYKFKPYVGDAIDAEGVIVGDETTLTTTLNPSPVSIEVPAFTTNEITKDLNVTKAVTFKNKHGEVIDVQESAVAVSYNGPTASSLTVTEQKDDGSGGYTDATGTDKVTGLKFNADTVGDYTVVVASGGASSTINFTVASASQLTSFELGSTAVSVIVDDTMDLETTATDDMTAIANGNTYKLIPITFKDQYGNTMNVNANDFNLQVTGTDSGTTPVVQLWNVTTDNAGENALATDAATEVKYLAIRAESTGSVDTSQALTLQMRDEAETADIGTSVTLGVTVQDARDLEALTATPASGSTVVNATQTIVISGVDQYGRVFDVDHGNVYMTAAASGEYTTTGATDNTADNKKADLPVKGITAGSYTVEVFYSENDASKDAGEKTVEIPFTVGEIGDAIDHIEIQPTVNVDPHGIGAYDTNLDTYKAQIVEDSVANNYTFTVKAYDVSSNEIAIADSDVLWSVVDYSTLMDDDTAVTSVAFDTTNKNQLIVTTPADDTDGEIAGTVTIKAATLNGKEDTMTVTFDSSTATAQTGNYQVATTATGLDGNDSTVITSVTLDETSTEVTDGVMDVYVVGLDQFGQTVNVTEGDLVIGLDSSVYVGADNTTDPDKITLTAKSVGTTNVRLFASGTQEVVIPVTVEQNAADAQAALVAADAADVAADKAGLTVTTTGAEALTAAKTNLVLGTATNGSAITWDASANSAVANDGTVTRPLYDPAAATPDVSGDVVASITKGAASDTKSFAVTVLAMTPAATGTVSNATDYKLGAVDFSGVQLTINDDEANPLGGLNVGDFTITAETITAGNVTVTVGTDNDDETVTVEANGNITLNNVAANDVFTFDITLTDAAGNNITATVTATDN